MQQILIVEDDERLASALRRGLSEAGYAVAVAYTGAEAMAEIGQAASLLIILDLGLPDCDGIDLLRQIRELGRSDLILILTAREEISDRVLGLDSGADDYLLKPFSFVELLARLRALLRRKEEAPETHRLVVGKLTIDLLSRRVLRGQREVKLTPREFDLLCCLARHEGEVVSREMLASQVWKETSRATSLDNMIDVYTSRLRKKLTDVTEESPLHVIRGVGIQLKAES